MLHFFFLFFTLQAIYCLFPQRIELATEQTDSIWWVICQSCFLLKARQRLARLISGVRAEMWTDAAWERWYSYRTKPVMYYREARCAAPSVASDFSVRGLQTTLRVESRRSREIKADGVRAEDKSIDYYYYYYLVAVFWWFSFVVDPDGLGLHNADNQQSTNRPYTKNCCTDS